MAKFDVDVQGVTYEVDAPDENTAWKWANVTHRQESSKTTPKPPAAPIANQVRDNRNIFSRALDETINSYPVKYAKESAGAIAEPILALGTGLISKPVSEVAGLAALGKDLITGNKEGDPEGFKRYVQEKLTYAPRTEAGSSEYNPLNAVPSLIGKAISGASNLVADPISGDSAGDSLRGAAGNFVREAIPQALGFLGVKKLSSLKPELAAKQAKLDLLKAQEKPFRDVVEASRKENLVIPPSSVNPSAINRAVESVGGKAATGYDASIKNQPTFNKLGRKAIGVTDDVPLTDEVFNTVREKAGAAYEDLKEVGQFSTDKVYADAIKKIGDQTKSQGNYATLKNQGIDDLVADLKKQNFDTSDTVALLKQLRNDANTNLGPAVTDPSKVALGRAQKQAAKALEGLVDRDLAAAEKAFPGHGYGEIANKFKEARETIAKSYTLQKATDTVTGNVDPRVLGRQLKAGKPLTGELKTLAQFGKTFEKASQNMQKAGSPVSATSPIISTLLAGTGYGAFGAPGIAASLLPLARPLARSSILSNVGQNFLTASPSYQIGGLSKAMTAGKPIAGIAAPTLTSQEEARTLAEQLRLLQQ